MAEPTRGVVMRSIYLTKQFQDDLEKLDHSLRTRVQTTIKKIEQNPYQKGTHAEIKISNGKVMRSRVNDNFRILWEWLDSGNIALWRVATHSVIDRVDDLPAEHKDNWRLFTRAADDRSLVELENLAVSRSLRKPFEYVPDNVLRLFGVADD
jgi:mRNA-degrading endonuclease RelE of RelBE toxin-antitoxin system